jgi:hypothetical protein
MMMKSAMARVMMREPSGVPVHLASAMIKSVDSNMSMGCPTPVKASGMSGTVAVCVTPEPMASCVSRSMDSEMSAGDAMPGKASALPIKSSGLRGTPAVHVSRGRAAATLPMGCPMSMGTAAAGIALNCCGQEGKRGYQRYRKPLHSLLLFRHFN